MKKFFFGISFLFLILTSFQSYAQTDSTQTEKYRPKFKLGVYYITDLNYYGRVDSLKSSGFFPMAEFWPTKNIYINAAPIFVITNGSGFEYAGSVATAGIRFGKPKKYSSNIYIVKPIYKDNSVIVQSALKAQLAGTYTWLNKIINVTIGSDVKYSNKFDYGATGGLDHIFKFGLKNNCVLVLDPSAFIYAGTQQFTKTSNSGGVFGIPGTQQQITQDVKKFNILSYEFSMPIVFAKGKIQLIALPAYVLPQNLITVANRPDLTERGKDLFYATLGAKVNF